MTMKLEFPLLGLLAARSMTGYDIARWTRVEGKFSGLDRHPSQIYRLLSRMETEGWVSHVVDPRSTAPDAKVYSVTDAGFARLLRWVHSVYSPPRRFQDPEFIGRLRIAAMVDLPRALQLLEEELEARRRQVAENRGRDRGEDHLSEAARPEIDVHALALFADELNAYGEAAIDQWISWLERMHDVITQQLAQRAEQGATEQGTIEQGAAPSKSGSSERTGR
ncbi:PadR family transcriptional regulator [Brachybacterium phenoliresistens]|uniref:PadR family transcriptional regulator n=1 Tax=Brachybacterium phenoliresistens TaxID=396014 RepID=Z9JPV5_9MICO|nr:PadR family transcriptional regulator [Brachybacterium phenoliresistens]EWS79792.1 PadR family transcriptional regulator [Brachybacterium phenoliresistens]